MNLSSGWGWGNTILVIHLEGSGGHGAYHFTLGWIKGKRVGEVCGKGTKRVGTLAWVDL